MTTTRPLASLALAVLITLAAPVAAQAASGAPDATTTAAASATR